MKINICYFPTNIFFFSFSHKHKLFFHFSHKHIFSFSHSHSYCFCISHEHMFFYFPRTYCFFISTQAKINLFAYNQNRDIAVFRWSPSKSASLCRLIGYTVVLTRVVCFSRNFFDIFVTFLTLSPLY